MNPRIELSPHKKLVGKFLTMSLLNNRTLELWRAFMPHQKHIRNRIDKKFYSIGIYNQHYFVDFNPAKEFIKWAAVEVGDFTAPSSEMNILEIPTGLYSVFTYKGKSSEASGFFQYIFSTWLPESDFVLDHRPHLEIMGEKYKNEDADSEEEIWIPIKSKA